MIRCVRCGTTNPEISQYCDECGESLQKPAAASSVETKADFSDSKKTMIEVETNFPVSETVNKSDFSSLAPERATIIDYSIPDSFKSPETENPFAAAEEQIAPVEQPVAPIEQAALAAGRADAAPFVGHARLLIERGKSTGKEFILSEQEINIGRWDADNGIFPDVDLDADDPEAKISRRHARIVRYGEQYLIEDLGSTNGTFVNRGRRLLPGNRQILSDGDELIVGKTFLRFQLIR